MLDWDRNPGLQVIYAISPTLDILLLELGPKSEPIAKGSQLADIIKAAFKAGAIIAARDVARKLGNGQGPVVVKETSPGCQRSLGDFSPHEGVFEMTNRTDNLISALNEVQTRARGEKTKGREYRIVPIEVDVQAIRLRLDLSQEEFAKRFGFPLGTLRNWEQGRRQPEGAARILLKIIDSKPELVERVLEEAAH